MPIELEEMTQETWDAMEVCARAYIQANLELYDAKHNMSTISNYPPRLEVATSFEQIQAHKAAIELHQQSYTAARLAQDAAEVNCQKAMSALYAIIPYSIWFEVDGYKMIVWQSSGPRDAVSIWQGSTNITQLF